MGRQLLLWILGLAVLYLLVLALVAVLPYIIGIGIIFYVGYRVHRWLAGRDETQQLEGQDYDLFR